MGHSRRWQVGPRKPGVQVHDPSSGEHDAPLRHTQSWRQPRPQEPCGQLCLHCSPMGSKSSEGQGVGARAVRHSRYPHPGSLTCPPRQAVALSSDGVTAICVVTLAALPAAGTKCPILGFRDEVSIGEGGTGEGGARHGGTEDGDAGDGGAGDGDTALRCCGGDTHRAGLVAAGAMPSRGAAADPTLGTAGGPVGAVAALIAARAPGTIRTRCGAVRSVPACGARGWWGGHGDGHASPPLSPTPLLHAHLPCRCRSRRWGSRQRRAGRSSALSSSPQRCPRGTGRSSAHPGGRGLRMQGDCETAASPYTQDWDATNPPSLWHSDAGSRGVTPKS